MVQEAITAIADSIQTQLPDARIIRAISLFKKRVGDGDYKYIPISCNETPSTCRPDLVEAVGMSANDVFFIWFGADIDRLDTTINSRTATVISSLVIYVWYNGERIDGVYCDIESCVVQNIIEAIGKAEGVFASDIVVDYSANPLRDFETYEPFGYFPYGFFSIKLDVKTKLNKCTPCSILSKPVCL